MRCVYLRWETADNEEDESKVSKSVKENDCTVVRKRFVVMSFQSILSTVHVAWENIAVHPLITELPYISNRFSINIFLTESGMW